VLVVVAVAVVEGDEQRVGRQPAWLTPLGRNHLFQSHHGVVAAQGAHLRLELGRRGVDQIGIEAAGSR
jgi:hypothetical protein